MSSQKATMTSSSASSTAEDSTTANPSSDPQTPNPERTDSTGGEQDSSPQNEQETPEQDTEQEPEPDQEPNPANAEAAKYRRRLRETEAERDALQSKLNSVIDNVITEKLQNVGVPARMLRRLDTDLSGVFDEQGNFSDERLLDLVNVTLNEMGLEPNRNLNDINRTHQRLGRIDWGKNWRNGYVPTAGTGPEVPPKSGWESVIKN